MIYKNTLEYIKKKDQNRPENIIKGIDPVSVGLLKQMYSALKDRGDNLVLYEKIWVQEIEKIYHDQCTYDSYFINGLDMLMKQAYNILTNDSKPWDFKKDELLAIVEKIIFLKGREDLFKDFFNEVESTILSAIQLDFSKRIGLTKIGNSKENIFSYSAVMLNMLIETLENSVISIHSVNEILANIPGIITIITDKKGKIRFINSLGENLFGVEKGALLKKSIATVIPGFEILEKKLKENSKIKNVSFDLVIGNNKSMNISALVSVTSTVQTPAIEELIYIIKLQQPSAKNTELDLKQKVHDKIAPINTLLGGLDLLSKKLIDADSKNVLESLKKVAGRLKENTNDELRLIASVSNEITEPAELINVDKINDEIIENISLNEGISEVEFIREIKGFNFYSKKKLFFSILQNLIVNAVKSRKPGKKTKIKILFIEQDTKIFLLQVNDTGIGIKRNQINKIFDASYRISNEGEGHGLGLSIVKDYVQRLNGAVEVKSTYGKETTFSILLPNLKKVPNHIR